MDKIGEYGRRAWGWYRGQKWYIQAGVLFAWIVLYFFLRQAAPGSVPALPLLPDLR